MHFDLTDLRLFLHVGEAGSITAGRTLLHHARLVISPSTSQFR